MSTTILLIEDDADISLGLKIRLEAAGYAVQAKANGAEGLKAVTSLHPDLVILDLGLPDVHGFDVLKKLNINPETSKIPVIILTAQGTTENFTKGMTADNVITFLEKPVNNEELIATVKVGIQQSKK